MPKLALGCQSSVMVGQEVVKACLAIGPLPAHVRAPVTPVLVDHSCHKCKYQFYMTQSGTAIKRSEWFQNQGRALLEHFDVISSLSEFGEVWSVGSYSYRLMQVPDLDFKVFCKALDRRRIGRLGSRLAARPDVMGMRLLDFTKWPAGGGNGIYLNLYPLFAGELWKLDLLFLLDAAKPTEPDPLLEQIRALSPEQRSTVLQFKADLLAQGRYAHPTTFHNTSLVHGVDVYRAVLEGARSLKDLDDLLARK